METRSTRKTRRDDVTCSQKRHHVDQSTGLNDFWSGMMKANNKKTTRDQELDLASTRLVLTAGVMRYIILPLSITIII